MGSTWNHKSGQNNCKVVRLLLFIFDVADLIADWLQYNDVISTEDGLVYGVYGDAIKYSLLVFSMLGSLFFLIEFSFHCYNCCNEDNESTKALDIVSLLSTWIEDVPQIIITVRIAACREDAITVFQLVKAIACILESIVKLGFEIYEVYQKHKKNIKTFREKGCTLKIMNALGLLVMLIASCCVFGFTHFSYDQMKGIDFKNHDGNHETQRYFENVHIFLNFNDSTKAPSMNDDQWIKLTGLQNIVTMDTRDIVRIEYDKVERNYLKIETTNSSDFPTFYSSGCYRDQSGQWNVATCSNGFFSGIDTNILIIHFKFEKPNSHKVLGDVDFNYKLYEKNCVQINSPTAPFQLQYFKIKDNVQTEDSYLAQKKVGTTAHFYATDPDLYDIYDVWKTGNFNCSSTARKFPEYINTLSITCQ